MTTTRATRLHEICTNLGEEIAKSWIKHVQVVPLDVEETSDQYALLYGEFANDETELDEVERAFEIILDAAQLRLIELLAERARHFTAERMFGDF